MLSKSLAACITYTCLIFTSCRHFFFFFFEYGIIYFFTIQLSYTITKINHKQAFSVNLTTRIFGEEEDDIAIL